ncbi:hypothetical protein VTJ83DRAFT_1410 [Remersonia thermophila]|uniref:Cell wall protein PhiA n=1 Tax=Remersonia thermophila TaxID=72144 RepID=A0ABR4DS23_9PEZI
MQFKTVLLSLLAAVASAAPSRKACPAPVRKFGIMALRSASEIHFGRVSATQSHMVLNLAEGKADAQCADGSSGENGAIFYIKDGELFLYGKDTSQFFFADRSGMGQGVMQYMNGTGGPLSGRLETKGWAVDENDNLTFNGNSLIACPNSILNGWNVWINVGSGRPAGQEGCLGFSARTVTVTNPVKCDYSIYTY